MIILGGIQYLSTDALSGKQEGREKIVGAIMGLLLAILSWLILYTINPNLLEISLIPPANMLPYTPSQNANQENNSPSTYTPTFSFIPSSPIYNRPYTLPENVPSYTPPTGSGNSEPPQNTGGTMPSPTPETPQQSGAGVQLSDPTNDLLIIQNCLGRTIEGACTGADVNRDNVIDSANIASLDAVSSAGYDFNKDGVIEFRPHPPLNACYFRTVSSSTMNQCYSGDSFASYYRGYTDTSPALPSSSCVQTNAFIDDTKVEALQSVLLSSQDSAAKEINLDTLLENILTCAPGADVLPCRQVTLAPDQILTTTTEVATTSDSFLILVYMTLQKYDTNKDRIVDLTLPEEGANADFEYLKSCVPQTGISPTSTCLANADINRDGAITADPITTTRNEFAVAFNISSIVFEIQLSQAFYFSPITEETSLFEIEEMYLGTFNFKDDQVVRWCATHLSNADSNCAASDINKNGTVNTGDLAALYQIYNGLGTYDVNGDGVIRIVSQ